MTSPEGPFFSTQDADSEGEEGKFYVWTEAEIVALLGQEDADVFNAVYGVEPGGNWEHGRNILHRTKKLSHYARLLSRDEGELRSLLERCRHTLFEDRSRRVWPGRDEKVLTAWNGLMIGALAQAAQVLDQPAHAEAAALAADFLLTRLRTPDGRLLRTWSEGTEPKLNGYLEDYAFVLDGLVSLYEATFAPRWIEAALELADVMVREFWDAGEGGFFFTGAAHESLIARTKDLHDNAIPSGNAMAVTGLLRLVKLTGRQDLWQKAEATLQLCQGLMAGRPMAAGQMLLALDFYLGSVQELALVGDPAAEETRQVLRAVRGQYRPRRVVAFLPEGSAAPASLPLLQGKEARGMITAYVCENFACQAPLVGPEAIEVAV
jgi:uncharacterized protein YyaL (SSP411 family)